MCLLLLVGEALAVTQGECHESRDVPIRRDSVESDAVKRPRGYAQVSVPRLTLQENITPTANSAPLL